MKKPFVSIIILNFNGIADTVKCLKSLYKTTYPNYEVLLVDNGSDNNEGSILAKRYHKKHKISNKEWLDCKKYFNYQCAYCGISLV